MQLILRMCRDEQRAHLCLSKGKKGRESQGMESRMTFVLMILWKLVLGGGGCAQMPRIKLLMGIGDASKDHLR